MESFAKLLDVVCGTEKDYVTVLPQTIDITSIKQLKFKREASNKEDEPMIESTFIKICGSFLQDNTTADPSDVFRLMDVMNEGQVTMRFFVFAYQLLCENTPEYRLSIINASARHMQSDIVDPHSLARTLLFVNICASKLDQNVDEVDEAAAVKLVEKVVCAACDGSYDEFLNEPPVIHWLEVLNKYAGVSEKDLDRRVHVERDLIALEMERLENTKRREDGPSLVRAESRSSCDAEPDSVPESPIPPSSLKSFSERSRGPVIHLRKSLSQVELDLPFSIDIATLKWKKVIGKGAYATVWNAEWLHMPVAVKVLHGEMSTSIGEDATSPIFLENAIDENNRRDFLREIEVLTQLRHPNVLLCMGACVSVGKPLCIVTELYNGGSLHELLHGPDSKAIDRIQTLDLIVEVARGMLYLHSSTPTILHRDLKASNILVDKHLSHCVICDFGLSKLVELGNINPSVHGGQDARGTPYTMAPEVMDGEAYTTAADVYSFGIILWELWTGKIPFDGLQPIQLMFKVYAEGERPPITPEDNIHPCIEELIVQCWDELPTARPTFEEILDKLEDARLREELQELTASHFLKSIDRHHDLMSAIQEGSVNRVQALLDGGCNVNFQDYDQRSPLHLAAAEKNADIVALLVANGANVNARDRWGSTPLHDAYLSSCTEGVELLLKAGATPETPSLHGNIPNVSLEKADDQAKPDERVENLSMELMRAIFRRDLERVQSLLRAGANPSFGDYDNRTPLHLAASEGAAEIGALLCQYNVDLEARDRWGSTPLMDAQRAGHSEVQLIIEVAKTKRNLKITQ